MHEAQIQLYSPSIVKEIVNLVDNDVIDEITSSVEKEWKAKYQAFLSQCDVADVLYQFVLLHMSRIVDVLNTILSDNK